jgi:hypothetical protein
MKLSENKETAYKDWRYSAEGKKANNWDNSFDSTAKRNFMAGWYACEQHLKTIEQETTNDQQP